MITNDNWLKMNYNGWSNRDLEDRKCQLEHYQLFGSSINGNALELRMVEMELERRMRDKNGESS